MSLFLRNPRGRAWWMAGLITATLVLLLLPPVRTRLAWYATVLRSRVYYALRPPQEAVFVPTPQPTPTPHPQATATPQPAPTATPRPSPTPVATPTPRPEAASWPPPKHEYQRWNNCAPATLSMALAVWGWQGNQQDLAPLLKPNPRDKNVFPHEIVDAVLHHTAYMALARPAGSLDLLRDFIAAGLPVMVEKGFEPDNVDGWMGHYVLVWGYDDARQVFFTHDSYRGPEKAVPYAQMEAEWRAFNFTYILVYPPARDGEVRTLLGQFQDPLAAWHAAARRAETETQTLTGRDAVFAWFNLGESHVALGHYAQAAQAFDQAFTRLAALPPEQRPWRWMWYHEGPYRAYYEVGRYDDVLRLATTTLQAMSEPVLEEAFYWRGRAYAALGDANAARADFQRALRAHPGYPPAQDALQALQQGASP